jgi:hypothetical protein
VGIGYSARPLLKFGFDALVDVLLILVAEGRQTIRTKRFALTKADPKYLGRTADRTFGQRPDFLQASQPIHAA